MSFIGIFLTAVSLAMDAFAVSVSNGISVKGFSRRDAVEQGVYFGAFQFFMPVLGYLLGSQIREYIEKVDHWVAFGLLAVIGINMIKEALTEEDDSEKSYKSKAVRLVLQAVATSIDAFAVGIGFALLNINLIFAASIIGVVAFAFSFWGGTAGKRLGDLFKKRAGVAGGCVLIVIGLNILRTHLFL